MDTTKYSQVILPRQLRERLDIIAQQEGRSLSNLVQRLIAEALAARDKPSISDPSPGLRRALEAVAKDATSSRTGTTS